MYVLGSGRYKPGIVRHIACFKLLVGMPVCHSIPPPPWLIRDLVARYTAARPHGPAGRSRSTAQRGVGCEVRAWQGKVSPPQATSPCSQGLSGVKRPCLSSPNLSSLSLSTRRSLRNSRLTANRCDSAGRVLPCNPSSMDAAGPDKVEGGRHV
jgi:hypothetical protein